MLWLDGPVPTNLAMGTTKFYACVFSNGKKYYKTQGHKLVYLPPTRGLASRGMASDMSICHLISAMHSIPLTSSCARILSN